jgi:hypothetical protein
MPSPNSQEHPAPAKPGGDGAAEQQPGGGADPSEHRPSGQSTALLCFAGEGPDDQGERRGYQHGPGHTLRDAGGDQDRGIRRQAACQRGCQQQAQPGQEHPPRAEEVGQAPAAQQEGGSRKRRGVERPLQCCAGQVQCLLYGRRGREQAGGSHHVDQERRAQEPQCDPEPYAAEPSGRRHGR